MFRWPVVTLQLKQVSVCLDGQRELYEGGLCSWISSNLFEINPRSDASTLYPMAHLSPMCVYGAMVITLNFSIDLKASILANLSKLPFQDYYGGRFYAKFCMHAEIRMHL